MGTRNNLSFVDKSHSARGILSLILGGMSIIAAILLIIFSYIQKGNAGIYAGSSGIVAMITAAIGVGYGIAGLREKEKRNLLTIIGLLLNSLMLIAWIALFISGL